MFHSLQSRQRKYWGIHCKSNDNPRDVVYSDYHYVNSGHNIFIVASYWLNGSNAGIFNDDLINTYDQTNNWGSHALNLSSIVFLHRAVRGVPRIFPHDSGGYIWN